MQSVKELRHLVEDTAEDLETQYDSYPGLANGVVPVDILFLELGLPQTRKPDADKIVEKLAEKDFEIDPESIRLTTEYDELARFLRRTVMTSLAESPDASQLAAIMLAVGRRLGRREVAELMGQPED